MENLSRLSKVALLDKAKFLADEDRKISLLLVEVLAECEKRMLHLELGYSSLWDFAVKYLQLSESAAQIRISAMRLCKESPKVVESLKSGDLSLSNAAQLQSFFREKKKKGEALSVENKSKIIDSVSGLSKKECEKKLLALTPHSVPKDKERQVTENLTELKLVFDDSMIVKLNQLMGLLAHAIPNASYSDIIKYMTFETLTRVKAKKLGKNSNKNLGKGETVSSLEIGKGTVGEVAKVEVVTRKAEAGIVEVLEGVVGEVAGIEDTLGESGARCLVLNGSEGSKTEISTAEKCQSGVGGVEAGAVAIEVGTKLLCPEKVSQLVGDSGNGNNLKLDKSFEDKSLKNNLIGDGRAKFTTRKYISVDVRRQVWRRAESRCEYVSKEGLRCSSRYMLEVDHVTPVALGSGDQRLRLLCKSHNLQQAMRWLGPVHMKKFISSIR